MKNFLPTLLACAISFGLTYFGLIKYASNNTTQPTENISKNNENKSADTSNELQEEENAKSEESEKTEIVYTANVNGAEIEKDYKAWKDYNKQNIELAYEFKPIDIDNSEITKDDFLNKLKTGLYIPLKIDDSGFVYKLYKLSDAANKKIGKSIRSSSSIAYQYFKKEGTKLPDFNFVDLNENEYTKSTTVGKIKIIKCWFINCVVCVQEFPELNKLYDRYETNEDVVFISLAFDKAEKLKKFLSKKQFRYPVIPEQKNYMVKELEIKQYPTHIVVDEDNNIIKMVNNVDALTTIIDYLIGSQEMDMGEDQLEQQF